MSQIVCMPTCQYDAIQSLHNIEYYNIIRKIRKHIKSLTDQAHYYSTRNDTQSSDMWFVKLLPSIDTVKEPIKLPVTSFNMSIQYWLRHHKGDVDGNEPFGAQWQLNDIIIVNTEDGYILNLSCITVNLSVWHLLYPQIWMHHTCSIEYIDWYVLAITSHVTLLFGLW